MTFTSEWAQLMTGKEVIIAYDNDEAGAKGAVRTLGLIPHAKVVQIPDRPNIKDLTDYAMAGGDLHELLDTAIAYTSLEQVKEDRGRRIAMFQSVRFHDAYIQIHTPREYTMPKRKENAGVIERAKEYPIPNMVQFGSNHKALCLWHAEKTPSLHYYKKNNTCYCFGGCGRSFDSIDVYRAIHNCSFTHAVSELNKLI